jgi:hypothetical protein
MDRKTFVAEVIHGDWDAIRVDPWPTEHGLKGGLVDGL